MIRSGESGGLLSVVPLSSVSSMLSTFFAVMLWSWLMNSAITSSSEGSDVTPVAREVTVVLSCYHPYGVGQSRSSLPRPRRLPHVGGGLQVQRQ